MKNLKDKKAFKILKIVFEVIVFLVLVGFILSVCLQRFSNNKLSIFNYRILNDYM